MTKAPEKVDPYGELVSLAGELVRRLALMQTEFATTSAESVEKRKAFSHATALALRIQKRALALAKANSRRKV